METKEVKEILEKISKVLMDIEEKNISIKTMEVYKRGVSIAKKLGEEIKFIGIMEIEETENKKRYYVFCFEDSFTGFICERNLKKIKEKLTEKRRKFED